jgi:D-alanyl-D-alanine carboxypeptidase (penicillin-binding protein 5/6)
VNQTQATIPVAGTIRNVNGMLGQGGYIGIKTGNSDEAGGCYLFAVKKDFAYGQSVIIVGAILGATDLFTAIKASEPLIESASKQFEAVKVLSKGQKVGSYQTPWGDATDVITSDDIFQVVQKGSSVKYSLQLKDRSIDDKSLDAGSIVVGQNSAVRSVPVVLKSPLKPPSFTQRLTINYKQ